VAGQDGGQAVPYRGKVYWFFGDTVKFSYPLGNFAESGAVSELPDHGGLDPSLGVDLKYFVDKTGFSRAMCPTAEDGLEWLFWAGVVTDASGQERLAGECRRMKNLGETLGRALVVFNDDTQKFDAIQRLSLTARLSLEGRPFRVRSGGHDFLYFPSDSSPGARVQADVAHLTSPSGYEGYTCLAPGSGVDASDARLERGADGRLVCGWKRETPPLNYKQQQALIAAGKLKPQEGLIQLRDFWSAAPVEAYLYSVEWNSYRKRWIMLVEGRVGEIWYAEGDTPLGPWVYSTKVVTHDRYAFYLPVQHAFFAQQNGRLLYFEATYTDFFSDTPVKTPRYDYNQVMYRLALDDSRLFLPVPVYRVGGKDGSTRYLLREGVDSRNEWQNIQEIGFFALTPDRAREGLVPLFATPGRRGTALSLDPPNGAPAPQPLFYAFPVKETEPGLTLAGKWNCTVRDSGGSEYPLTLQTQVEGASVRVHVDEGEVAEAKYRDGQIDFQVKVADDRYHLVGRLQDGKLVGTWTEAHTSNGGTWVGTADQSFSAWKKSTDIVPLYEYRHVDGSRIYSTEPNRADPRWRRSAEPVCRVWRNPASLLILDRDATAVPAVQ